MKRSPIAGNHTTGNAINQQEFSNKNSACIHCGICVTACPMDFLNLDSDCSGILDSVGRPKPILPTAEGERIDEVLTAVIPLTNETTKG